MSLDEAQATFVRKPDGALSDPMVLERYVGKYKLAAAVLEVQLTGGSLWLVAPGSPRFELLPYKPAVFKAKEFADLTFQFAVQNLVATSLVQRDPSGEYRFERLKWLSGRGGARFTSGGVLQDAHRSQAGPWLS